MLAKNERDRLIALGREIIPAKSKSVFATCSLDGILDLLRRDKKTEGTVLKLATLEHIGQMRFIDLPLDSKGVAEVQGAVSSVLAQI
jgi:3-dehydroquinate synthetase